MYVFSVITPIARSWMSSHVAQLPPSLRTNNTAVKLAEKLDNKSEQLAKARETAGRPSRVKRGMSALAGAGAAGVLSGFVESEAAKNVITTGIAVGSGVVGAMFDSDILVDAGIGAGSVLSYKLGEAVSGGVKRGMQGSDDDSADAGTADSSSTAP